MKSKPKLLLASACIVALLVIGTAMWFSWTDRAGSNGRDSSTSPLGGLFGRASAVANLKQRMGELRDLHPAFTQFAQAHQDDLPKTVAELRPFLPAKLAFLDDEHWELPASGKLAAVLNGSDSAKTILLQEKSLLPDRPRIIIYGDGHIEYRK
jgi:hypothetical protein